MGASRFHLVGLATLAFACGPVLGSGATAAGSSGATTGGSTPAESSGATTSESESDASTTSENEPTPECLVGSSPGGELLWSREHQEVASCTRIAELPRGDLVVLGTIEDRGVSDVFVRVLAPDGEERWSHRYEGDAHLADWATELAVDDEGFALVLLEEQIAANPEVFRPVLLRFTEDGELVQRHEWQPPADDADWFDSRWGSALIAADGREPLMVGVSYRNLAVRRLDPSADVVQEWTIEGPTDRYFWEATVSRTGTVLALRVGAETAIDRFDADGDLTWSAELSPGWDGGAHTPHAGSVAIGPDDRVFALSSSDGASELHLYEPDGTLAWSGPVDADPAIVWRQVVARCDGRATLAGVRKYDDGPSPSPTYEHSVMQVDAEGRAEWTAQVALPITSYWPEARIAISNEGDVVGCFPLGGTESSGPIAHSIASFRGGP